MVSESIHFLTTIECLILRRTPQKYVVDGLPHAMMIVVLQFALIQLVSLPLYIFTFLLLYNGADRQALCSTIDVLQHNCTRAVLRPMTIVFIILVCTQTFMMVYTIVEYLVRQLDQIIFERGKTPGKRAQKIRKRLKQVRKHVAFQGIFVFIVSLQCYASVFALTVFTMYMLLGACIQPFTLIPVLAAIAAIFVILKTTYSALTRSKDSIEARLSRSPEAINDFVDDVQTAVDDALSEAGFNQGQILLYTIFVSLVSALFLGFVTVGCSLFISLKSLVPTLLSSGISLSSGLTATLQTGELPENSLTSNDIGTNFARRLQDLQAEKAKMEVLLDHAEVAQQSVTA